MLALRAGLDDGAFALDCRKRAAVEVVDIAPNLQLAGVIHEGSLIGEMHPDLRRLQLDLHEENISTETLAALSKRYLLEKL